MAEETTISEESRIRYLDYLRVLAAFAVILLHVSAQHWDTEGVRFRDRLIFACYNSMAVWPVNVFMMLSGALFLNPERGGRYQGTVFKVYPAHGNGVSFLVCGLRLG